MNSVTKKWLFMKISSAILIPLMVWFILNLVSIFDKDYIEVVNFFTTQPSKILVSLTLVFAYFFSALSISEVFEDYIQDEKIKNAANKVLNIFAILMPLITIIVILNLNTLFVFLGIKLIEKSCNTIPISFGIVSLLPV